MRTLADRSIAALRATHDELAAVVPELTDEQLTGPSGASDWTVAQVLSHLGSGAEIAHAGYRAALDGEPAPGKDFDESVWDRWNAMNPQQQAAGFLEHDGVVLHALEALSAEQRESTTVKLAFLPAPLSLASAIGMRLNETTLHSWDIRVALDPYAKLGADAAEVLVDHFTGGLGFLLGFLGKADQLPEAAVIAVAGSDVAIVVGDSVGLSRSAGEPTARFDAEIEAALRLLGGRLKAPYVPPGLQVTGNVTLADLQRAFPGF
ncbi:MAG: maleylpyruvate isomerase family mycothiol-dependent enzyme [Frankiaceae bacterium]